MICEKYYAPRNSVIVPRMLIRVFITITIISILPFAAKAQNIENYIPPSLFDSHAVAPDQPKPIKTPKLPKLSKPAIEIKKVESKQVEIQKDTKPAKEKVEPPKPSPKPEPKQNFAKPIEVDKPKPRSEGIVKGPKTMPAVKKQGVETEILFEPKVKAKPMINNDIIVETPKTVPNLKKEPIEKPFIEDKEFVFTYSGNEVDLPDLYNDILSKGVLAQLSYFPNYSIDILSVAPMEKNVSLSAGRRTALTRALKIREYLIENDISSDRIDVRALSAQDMPERANRIILEINE